MSITKEQVVAAENLLVDTQAQVFFRKLGSLNIVPSSEEEAQTLWKMGDSILRERPRNSEDGRITKQASCELFKSVGSELADDGYSKDAHDVTESLFQNPEIVKAAHILLAAGNV